MNDLLIELRHKDSSFFFTMNQVLLMESKHTARQDVIVLAGAGGIAKPLPYGTIDRILGDIASCLDTPSKRTTPSLRIVTVELTDLILPH